MPLPHLREGVKHLAEKIPEQAVGAIVLAAFLMLFVLPDQYASKRDFDHFVCSAGQHWDGFQQFEAQQQINTLENQLYSVEQFISLHPDEANNRDYSRENELKIELEEAQSEKDQIQTERPKCQLN